MPPKGTGFKPPADAVFPYIKPDSISPWMTQRNGSWYVKMQVWRDKKHRPDVLEVGNVSLSAAQDFVRAIQARFSSSSAMQQPRSNAAAPTEMPGAENGP